MDIANRTPRKIRCIDNSPDVINGGYSHFLKVGHIYNLIKLNVHNCHTEVSLKEFPRFMYFNSVLFEEV